MNIVYMVLLFIICVLILALFAGSIFYRTQAIVNHKLQIRIASLTAENIELEKNLEECKQTLKVFQKLYPMRNEPNNHHKLEFEHPDKYPDKFIHKFKNDWEKIQ